MRNEKTYRLEDAKILSDDGHVRMVQHPDGVKVAGALDDMGTHILDAVATLRKDDPNFEIKKLFDGTTYLVFQYPEKEDDSGK